MEFLEKQLDTSGVSVLLLQRKLERFSTERLQRAMELGWRREHNAQTFFAKNLSDEGAVIKLGQMFITMLYCDRRLGSKELGDTELPTWAYHTAHSSLEYKCPGGIPEGELRDQFHGFLGLLVAELLDENVTSLFFVEECVLVPNCVELVQELRSGESQNPVSLAKKLGLS
ncbi:MAG: hypothetical protein ABI076_01290 [Acidobacteriaceae bacterium]